jgi:hypothetical protein
MCPLSRRNRGDDGLPCLTSRPYIWHISVILVSRRILDLAGLKVVPVLLGYLVMQGGALFCLPSRAARHTISRQQRLNE